MIWEHLIKHIESRVVCATRTPVLDEQALEQTHVGARIGLRAGERPNHTRSSSCTFHAHNGEEREIRLD